MPEGVTVALAHEGHAPGVFSSLCRACRIGADLERIREIGEAAVPALSSHGYTPLIARAYIRRFLWSRGQIEALQRARLAGMTVADLIEAVEEARREVTAGRD